MEVIEEEKKAPQKEGKKIIFWGGITGSIAAIVTGSFLVTRVSIQRSVERENEKRQETEADLEKKGKALYQKYLEENNDILNSIYQFYQKAGTAIYDEKLAVITPSGNGYLTINEDGIFKWVSFDGIIYDTPTSFLERCDLKKVPDEKRKDAISSIMGIEKQTSFTFNDFTLLSEVKEENLYQTIYQSSKKNLGDVKVVAKGEVYQTLYGYTTIYTSTDGMIKADNLVAFAVLYENKDLYMWEQMPFINQGRKY